VVRNTDYIGKIKIFFKITLFLRESYIHANLKLPRLGKNYRKPRFTTIATKQASVIVEWITVLIRLNF